MTLPRDVVYGCRLDPGESTSRAPWRSADVASAGTTARMLLNAKVHRQRRPHPPRHHLRAVARCRPGAPGHVTRLGGRAARDRRRGGPRLGRLPSSAAAFNGPRRGRSARTPAVLEERTWPGPPCWACRRESSRSERREAASSPTTTAAPEREPFKRAPRSGSPAAWRSESQEGSASRRLLAEDFATHGRGACARPVSGSLAVCRFGNARMSVKSKSSARAAHDRLSHVAHHSRGARAGGPSHLPYNVRIGRRLRASCTTAASGWAPGPSGTTSRSRTRRPSASSARAPIDRP